MSHSFGNQPPKPRRPGGNQPPYRANADYKQPDYELELTEEDGIDEEKLAGYERAEPVANWTPRKPSKPGGMRRGAAYSNQIQPEKIEHTKRLVALIVDSLVWYFGAMLITVIPYVNHVASLSMTWLFLLLTRDYWFSGRGIGKNVMGLQVVDVKTGAACSLKQSVLRNIIILAPFAVLQIIGVILTFVRIAWLNETLKGVVEVVGMVYLAIVLPLECYRAYNRDDSLRLGDQLAGTALVEAPTDFSNPLSK